MSASYDASCDAVIPTTKYVNYKHQRGCVSMHWSKGKKLLVRSLCVLTASSLMAAPAYAASATSITRLDGNTRYETMGRVVQTAFPKQSDYAVLASGDNFPDALAASSLAGALKAPIILTSSTTLSSEARNELQRLEARTVAIVGGSSAVSTAARFWCPKLFLTERLFDSQERLVSKQHCPSIATRLDNSP